ncbi:MAG: voltage-gated sodium channel [Alteromonadaceae bacterium]|jgi:voltage-gated sodium channel
MDNKLIAARLTGMRNNKSFEFFIMGVIIISAIMVGVKTYELSPLLVNTFIFLDWMITLIFLFEITIRFLAMEKRLDFFKDTWNIFDTLIVTISLIPLEDSEMVLVARLVRVFRVLRMISIIPELRILMNSFFKALPRLGYVMALMFIIFYIYAAFGSLFFEKINPVLWGDIAISLLTLFRVMTFEGWTDILYEVMAVYPWGWLYFITFIFLTTFAFLNMVIGIMVNVLEEEHINETELNDRVVTLKDLHGEIQELKALIRDNGRRSGSGEASAPRKD